MDISGWIEHWAAFAPEKPAIRFEGQEIGYRAFRDRIRRAARLLSGEIGIARGDRIAHLGYNSPDFFVLLFACARLGAMLVPLNWRLAPPEHLYILEHAGVRALFTEPGFDATVESVGLRLGGCRTVGLGKAGEFDALLARAAGADRAAGVTLGDPVLIVYTSGTTGRPKGAVLSQLALTVNAVNAVAAHDLSSGDVVLVNLPIFHVGGMNIQTTPAFHAGASVVLQPRFEPGAAIEAIAAERPTLTILVPALMQALMDHAAWPEIDLGSLRCIDTGSTTVPDSLLRAYLDRGTPVIQIYGATETAPIAIHQRIPDAWTTAGSTGRPALHCEARIVDADGRSLPAGDKGEIAVRGPNVMTGYWNDPEATSEAIVDGWFRTGDVGHTDEGGNFYVDDRIKDVIISGSENVYPAELEAVLDGCPRIAEAAVVAAADAKWGEVPVAFAVRRGPIAESEALALFNGRLARYKHPREVRFVDALPRNAMGKVLKYELRARLAEADPMVGGDGIEPPASCV